MILKHKKKWLLVLFLAFAGFIYRSSVFRITKNFEEVDPGKFYRSAQLTPDELDEAISKYGIKTVISLRGAPENSYWVRPQREILEKRGVKFIPLSWTIDFFPATDVLQGYVRALKEEQYPILVHCKTGADRTGLATSLYAMQYMNTPIEAALDKYLSIKNYHVRAFHPAMSQFARVFQGAEWALSRYNHCAPENKPWSEPGHCP